MNETGSSLTFVPGLLVGGRVEQECPPDRSIGYYLEPLLALGPFCKAPLHATLTGVTNNQADPSVDLVRASALPVLKKFLLGKQLSCCMFSRIRIGFVHILRSSTILTRLWSRTVCIRIGSGFYL